MAQPYVSGPVPIFIAPRVNGALVAPALLGFGETAPDIEEEPEWEGVMVDWAGSKLPGERLYEGAEASSSVTLTNWNEKTLRIIQAYPGRAGAVRGVNAVRPGGGGAANAAYGDIGSAMITEGLAFCVWFLFPYTSKPAFNNAINGPMPKGFRFPYTLIQGKPVRRNGTKANKMSLNFKHMRGIEGNNLVLSDEDMALVANLAWN